MDVEKDIKILENYLKDSSYKERNGNFFPDCGWEIVDLEIPKAMANILLEFKQDKKKIKELEAKLEEANRQLDLDYVDKNYVPVKKVKDELKRAEKENEPCEKYEKESRMYWINQGVISLCRRLLKEGD